MAKFLYFIWTITTKNVSFEPYLNGNYCKLGHYYGGGYEENGGVLGNKPFFMAIFFQI